METEPRLKVLSDRLVKPGIEPAITGLQGKRFIHYTTAAPDTESVHKNLWKVHEIRIDRAIDNVLYDFLGTVKAAPHECVITGRTGQTYT